MDDVRRECVFKTQRILEAVSLVQTKDFDGSLIFSEEGSGPLYFLRVFTHLYIGYDALSRVEQENNVEPYTISPAAMGFIFAMFQKTNFNSLSPTCFVRFFETVMISRLQPHEAAACILLYLVEMFTTLSVSKPKDMPIKVFEMLMSQGVKHYTEALSYGGRFSYTEFMKFCDFIAVEPSNAFCFEFEHFATVIGTVELPPFVRYDEFTQSQKDKLPLFDFFRGIFPSVSPSGVGLHHNSLLAIKSRDVDKFVTAVENDTPEKLLAKYVLDDFVDLLNKSIPNVTFLKMLLKSNRVWRFHNVDHSIFSEADKGILQDLKAKTDYTLLVYKTFNPVVKTTIDEDVVGFVAEDELAEIEKGAVVDELEGVEKVGEALDDKEDGGKPMKTEDSSAAPVYGGKRPRKLKQFEYAYDECLRKIAKLEQDVEDLQSNHHNQVLVKLQKERDNAILEAENLYEQVEKLKQEVEVGKTTGRRLQQNMLALDKAEQTAVTLRKKVDNLEDLIQAQKEEEVQQESNPRRQVQPLASIDQNHSAIVEPGAVDARREEDVEPVGSNDSENPNDLGNSRAVNKSQKGQSKLLTSQDRIDERIKRCKTKTKYPDPCYKIKNLTPDELKARGEFLELLKKEQLDKCCRRTGDTFPCWNMIFCKYRLYYHRRCLVEDLKKYKKEIISVEAADTIIQATPFFCFACLDKKNIEDYGKN